VWSWITVMHDGSGVEVATVGNEGFIGMQVFLGGGSVPGQCFCQVPGAFAALSARDFREALERSQSFRTILQRYTQGLLNQIAQSAACNRLHTLERRCARWILMTRLPGCRSAAS
jgi:hypothetical protein